MNTRLLGLVGIFVGCGLAAACGDDDEEGRPTGSPEQTGSSCAAAAECYPGVDHAQLSGEVLCLAEEVRDGYCTHECATDDDCCAADGECATEFEQVCSPFESLNRDMCFLSCEGIDNADEFCQTEVSPFFGCRSSGGGVTNRKICMPAPCGAGASCAGDADCDSGFTCNREYPGGYCARDCSADVDCGADAACVVAPGGGNVCLRKCASESDCTFCRADLSGSRCTGDVQLVESSGVTVCSPFPD